MNPNTIHSYRGYLLAGLIGALGEAQSSLLPQKLCQK
jgi:hypothetical protein